MVATTAFAEEPQAPTQTAAPAAAPAGAPAAGIEVPPLPIDVQDGIGFAWNLVKLVAILGGMAGLGAIAVRVIGPRFSPLAGKPGDMIRVVDVKRLDTKTSLYLVEVAGKHTLLSVSENEVRGLSALELDDQKLAEQVARRDVGAPRVAFGQILARGKPEALKPAAVEVKPS